MAVWLVVGLGNPGPTYQFHRHNVGFMVVDELARRAGERFTRARDAKADIVQTRVTGTGFGGVGADAQRVILAKPRTFMNESGGPVGRLARFAKISPVNIVVIHDELDLEPGDVRVRTGGGDNGHNGLRSIRQMLGSGDFVRVRFGIGRPPGRQAPADFVLSNYPPSAREDLAVDVARAADIVETHIRQG